MSNTIQALIDAMLKPIKELKSILSQRMEHVENEIEQFNDRFMHDRN